MQLLYRDVVFPCRDSVLLLYYDNVATEVSLLPPRWSRQESGVATDLALGRDFMSQVFFCHDRVWSRPRLFLS